MIECFLALPLNRHGIEPGEHRRQLQLDHVAATLDDPIEDEIRGALSELLACV